MTDTKKKTLSARERILAKAEELFYTQGFQATGINQIIAESDVAKATFYAHFPSKDDLCAEYMREHSRRGLEALEAEAASAKTPLARFLRPVESLVPWMEETKFRGCAFLNMVPEVPDPSSPVRLEGSLFYRRFGQLLETLARELITSDPKKYGHLKPAKLAADYLTIIAGAITLAELHHDIGPMQHGLRMVRELVEPRQKN